MIGPRPLLSGLLATALCLVGWLGGASPASAQDLRLGIDVPEAAATLSTQDATWLDPADLNYNDERSVAWNTFFRPQQGSIGGGFEFFGYEYDDSATRNDDDVIEEFHGLVHFAGTLLPGVRIFAAAGVNSLQLDLADDSRGAYEFRGFTVDVGLDFGIPISDFLTLEFWGRFRIVDSTRQTSTVTEEVYSQRWDGRVIFDFQLIGSRDQPSLNLRAGGGYQTTFARWDFTSIGAQRTERIRPDDSFYGLAGLVFIPFESVSFFVETTLPTPLAIYGGVLINI